MEAQISEARIDELEAKLSFAEDLIDELNRSVFRQQEQLDLMQQQLCCCISIYKVWCKVFRQLRRAICAMNCRRIIDCCLSRLDGGESYQSLSCLWRP
jgi:hypothetical protein